MESEKQEQPQHEQGGEFLKASSYQEQELRHNNSIGDEGRDEGAQAGDFLRGSRGDDPSSALLRVLQDHHHCEKTSSTTKSNSKGSAAPGEKSGEAVQTEKGMHGEREGDDANGKGPEQKSSPHPMPHQEVPQPGQYTDIDAVVEFVALADV